VYTVCYSGGTLCYMKRYGVRELRQNASMLLRQVAAGETIEITNNGQPVAQLIPAVYDPWAALVASKEVSLARTSVADILTRSPRPYLLPAASTTELQDDR
jgi:prevent-host-death family protein